MKYQTLKFPKPLKPFDPKKVGEAILDSQEKNTNYATFHKIEHFYYGRINIPKEGGIVFELTDALTSIQGELCCGYILYLGFKDTKKLNETSATIKKSLENLCTIKEEEL
ncbi:MAG: hypothetical protein PF542_04125 [Nanoarchaeota archaeon]|jgi:hypothetical protein|nr:hypothetical protein [Nanoarchaeota archaeon]